MRISTVQIFNNGLHNLLNQQAAVSKIQNQIATGKRINTAADDPIGASQIVVLKQNIAQTQRFQTNVDVAQGALELEESVLTNVTNGLQRLRELNVQANSTALNGGDRQAIAQELESLKQELVGLANSQDGSGRYMFSGYQSGSKTYISDGNGGYVYQGDQGQRELEISAGLVIPINDSGFNIFENIPNGNGDFSVSDPAGLNTGDAVVKSGSIVDSGSYVKETYTLSFVANASGDLAYQVMGSTSGQLVPALPAVTPAAAPAYKDGQAIVFNGIEMTITGQPNVGDDFQLQPSTGQSIFSSIDAMITNLLASQTTPSQRAAVQTQMNQSMAEIDQALDAVINVRTAVGARLNSLETASDINANFELHSRSTLSALEDLDLAEAITELNFQTITLQAAQQTYARITNLSLFNVI